MVDQVRFPPYIGGSGKTYTNDANPETGMFNGGHRINFFPILSDTVAAAGYVSQYAQAIDGAKSNADRAENARGYVEAVADAYQVNILDQFRRKATLDIDFSRGLYRADNGVFTQSGNVHDALTLNKTSADYSVSASGRVNEIPINEVSRLWIDGEPLGASTGKAKQCLNLWSSDFTKPEWSKNNLSAATDSIASPLQGVFWNTLTEVATPSPASFSLAQLYTPITSSSQSFVAVVAKGDVNRSFRFRISDSSGSFLEHIFFNPVEGVFHNNSDTNKKLFFKAHQLSFGWLVKVCFIHTSMSIGRVEISLSLAGTSTLVYQGSGQVALRIANLGVFEHGGLAPAPVVTGSARVAAGDVFFNKSNPIDFIDTNKFSVIVKVRREFYDYTLGQQTIVGSNIPTFRPIYITGLGGIACDFREYIPDRVIFNDVFDDELTICLSIDNYDKILILAVNGLSTSEDITGSSSNITFDELVIGDRSVPGNNRFEGVISNFIVLPFPLTATEAREVTAK